MSPILFLILLIPVAISLGAKYILKFDISWKEFAVQVVLGCAILAGIWAIGRFGAAEDVEILNGSVTKVYSERFSCPMNTMESRCQNGYDCNSRQVCTTSTDSKGNKTESCHEEHDRCYVYSWEQDWYVQTNVQRGPLTIHRVDDQGRYQPPRHRRAYVGEPASARHGYRNWVKASADSMFHQSRFDEERYAPLLKEKEPTGIDDYYRVDRIVTPGWRFRNDAVWNKELSEILKDLGPTKQLNMVIVITRNTDPDFAYAMQRQWQGFKKNDSVIFLGVDSQGNIKWTDVMSWSREDIYNVKTRGYLNSLRGQNINALNIQVFMGNLHTLAKTNFVRRSMQEFEYLKSEIPPPTWLVVLSIILAIMFGAGTSYLFNQIDLGGTTWNNRKWQ